LVAFKGIYRHCRAGHEDPKSGNFLILIRSAFPLLSDLFFNFLFGFQEKVSIIIMKFT